MKGSQASLTEFQKRTPEKIIERVQRKAQSTLAARSSTKIEVSG
ncbi:hypothetical protein [Halovenus carboxidivorans]|nr:hypothetical protein [Halovenus carboxidivorans]